MHHFLGLDNEFWSSESSPSAGGGYCHKAAATTEVISGANFWLPLSPEIHFFANKVLL